MPRTAYSLLLAALLLPPLAHCSDAVPTQGYTVVRTYPHDTAAFTEGLFYLDGFLYESTGELGRSSVRKVELETGRVLQQVTTPLPLAKASWPGTTA